MHHQEEIRSQESDHGKAWISRSHTKQNNTDKNNNKKKKQRIDLIILSSFHSITPTQPKEMQLPYTKKFQGVRTLQNSR